MAYPLKTYIKSAFPFGKYALGYDILGLIAKKGGTVEYQITNHLAQGTRRRVNNVITNFLIPYGFLYEKQATESRRNVKNAFGKGKEIKPRKYYLTFKGFLVSIGIIPLKDNYVTKKYLDLFPEESKNDALEYIKNEITIYLFYNSSIGLDLNYVKDIVFHMDDTNPRWDVIDIGESVRQDFKKIEEKQGKLSEKILENDDLFYFIDYWARTLELLVEGIDESKLSEKLEKESIWSKVDPNFLESNFKLSDIFKNERQKQIDYE